MPSASFCSSHFAAIISSKLEMVNPLKRVVLGGASAYCMPVTEQLDFSCRLVPWQAFPTLQIIPLGPQKKAPTPPA